MFPKRIRYLLKFYDFCGFHTETSKIQQQKGRIIFVIHVLMACLFSYSIVLFLKQPTTNTDTSLNMVNRTIQYTSALLTYWLVIFESYIQRSYQRQFWCIHEQTKKYNSPPRRHRHPNFRNYLFKCIEYLSIFSLIQIFLMFYFKFYVGDFFYFMITYIILVKMYQNRLFYYLFHLELIKHEMEIVQDELKRIVLISKWNLNDLEKNRFRQLREHYKLVYEMVNCVNEIFGWSQFTTIFYSFDLPLTDLNWAYLRIYQRSIGYKMGRSAFFMVGSLEKPR